MNGRHTISVRLEIDEEHFSIKLPVSWETQSFRRSVQMHTTLFQVNEDLVKHLEKNPPETEMHCLLLLNPKPNYFDIPPLMGAIMFAMDLCSKLEPLLKERFPECVLGVPEVNTL